MGDFKNAAILINLFTRWHHQEVLEDIEIYRGILQNYINILFLVLPIFFSISTFYTNIEYIMRTHLRNEISFVIFHIFTMLKVIFNQIWPCLVGLSYP